MTNFFTQNTEHQINKNLFVTQMQVIKDKNFFNVIGKITLNEKTCDAYGEGTLGILQRILMHTIGLDKDTINLNNYNKWRELLLKYASSTYSSFHSEQDLVNKKINTNVEIPAIWYIDFVNKKIFIKSEYYNFYFIYIPRFQLQDFELIKI